ncbi:MAG: ATP-dependent DNA helicase, partial [Proteobacteria bacterium]|nr:ATP-dependent DNA helicase [Pseudomonadota bacterium]
VEPARNLAKLAQANGVDTLNRFVNREVAQEIIATKGHARLVTAAGVFFHLEELLSVTQGVADLIGPQGVFYVQAIYLGEILRNTEFDNIYHEHLTYWTIRSLDALFSRFGLEIVRSDLLPIHGGSLELFVTRKGTGPVDPSVNRMRAEEERHGYGKIETYREFANRVWSIGEELIAILRREIAAGKRLYAFGAPAKGATLLNTFKISRDLIPYAVEKNGLVFLPPDLPMPSDPLHTGAMLEAVTPLLKSMQGGMFCLFTSHRALGNARKWFRTNKSVLAGRKLLVQGSAPRDDLLRRFRNEGNAVLLGTGSFWEGVDVRGQALTVVAIDKLPFGSPADPLMMARLEFIRRNGGNGFTEHQIPQAVLAMKQGAGRLLRDQNDYGVIVLCDPRITSKNYGRKFLQSFEPMPLTSSIEEAKSFLRAHEAAAVVA